MNHAPDFRVFTNSILGHVRVGLSTVFTEGGEKSGGSGEKVILKGRKGKNREENA